MKQKLQKILVIPGLRHGAGAALIIVGLAGIILPILPGWVFIFYGMELLGLGFLIPVFIKDLMKKLERHAGFRKK